MSNLSSLPKDVKAIINPPIWDSYHYVSVLLRKTYERAIEKIPKQNKKFVILDYGCGSKPYKYLFENHIEKYIGVDIGDNPHADFQILPGERLKFEDNTFDIVISSQVLEHVQEVDEYVNECYRVLKKDGCLLLSTHGTWQYHAAPYDFNRWTSIGLKILLERFNFEVTDFYPVLGQLALTSQLRLSFYYSAANFLGVIGKIILLPVSIFYQAKMKIEDLMTPQRVKERDSAIFVVLARKP